MKVSEFVIIFKLKTMNHYINLLKSKYEKHENQFEIGFFAAGFVFDVLTLSKVDDVFSILQQVFYLLIIGLLLFYDFLFKNQLFQPIGFLKKLWPYRELVLHFVLGSLLSVYSLFYLKSSSFFANFIFVFLLLVLLVLNETRWIKKSKIDVKLALFIICVFSFFSLLMPILLGFVGVFPFVLSILLTSGFIYFYFFQINKKFTQHNLSKYQLAMPSLGVILFLIVFYLLELIPPVPLSISNLGVFHKIERYEQQYHLFFEKEWWQFWKKSSHPFVTEPADKIHLFVQVFSPARFSDQVIMHWSIKNKKGDWQTTDKIPLLIKGGREQGYRGFAVKQNYEEGDWKISIETTDGREIGRSYFSVQKTDTQNPHREFSKITY